VKGIARLARAWFRQFYFVDNSFNIPECYAMALCRELLSVAETLHLDALRTTVGIRIYRGTPLAGRAVEERVIEPDDPLLSPRFYLARGLEPWIHERVNPGMHNCA
jgi:hypothetical protein